MGGEKVMKIVIMHQTVTNHDAIGNDIEMMYEILNKSFECSVYAENRFNKNVTYISENELDEVAKDRTSLIIYHHSVFWENGERLLKRSKCHIIFRYHNITPQEFFEPYNEFHFHQCKKGREQTLRFTEEFKQAFWLLDSNYNGEDIKNVDDSLKAVCPPFHKIESWASAVPDEKILSDLLYSKDINLLFVGRIAPNKGHLFLIDTLYNYCYYYGKNIHLYIIGKFDDGLQEYNNLILQKIKEYGLENNISFIGEVNDSILVSYYLGCDFFVCASDHEGFCVPLLEAQYFKLPIIAKRSSAIAETLGKKQVILNDSIKTYASAINVLNKDNRYYNYLQEEGKRNFLERFTFENIENKFLTIINSFI